MPIMFKIYICIFVLTFSLSMNIFYLHNSFQVHLVILTFSSFATVSYMVMLLTFPYCTIKSISVALVKVLSLSLFAKLLSASVTVEFSVASTNCGCVQAKLIVVLVI